MARYFQRSNEILGNSLKTVKEKKIQQITNNPENAKRFSEKQRNFRELSKNLQKRRKFSK